MSADRSHDELDYLLAAGRLAGPVQDRILENVLGETGRAAQPTPVARRGRMLMGLGGALVAVAAAVVLVALPRARTGEGTFTAKGSPSSGAAPLVDVQC